MPPKKVVSSRETFAHARSTFVPKDGPSTARAEQHAKKTGKLNPLVDPKGYGVIRRSLIRFVERPDGLWEVAIGTPMAVENRLDTTGSMGDNVDIALEVLPDAFGLASSVLSGYDLQMATGIFGDVTDQFVLCRPQFEMDAAKITEQLTLMVPEHDGGDSDEDPHYGLFGAAYLTAFYVNRLGLKSYDFTTSDAMAHTRLDESQLRRIYGEDVFEKVAENGHQINHRNLPTIKEMVRGDLLKRAHAFFLQVDDNASTTRFWSEIFGRERVIVLPSTRLLPQVQAAIIGLTEGTLSLGQVKKFLTTHNVSAGDAEAIMRSVAGIPIGVQAALPNYDKRPQKGDAFRQKTDLWPVDPSELGSEPAKEDKPETDWL